MDAKSSNLLLFSAFGCFCLLVGYMLLMFCYSLEQVPCWLCNCLLMEMCIMLHGDGWWGVSALLMKGDLQTCISGASHRWKQPAFLDLSFLLMCICDF